MLRIDRRTGIQLSVLGFGSGAVGGPMVRDDPLEQERTIARAIAIDANYFDTAVSNSIGKQGLLAQARWVLQRS